MQVTKVSAKVLEQKAIATGIYDLTVSAPEIAGCAVAGQFVNLYCADGARLLPRPISLCDVDAGKGTIRMVYRVAGGGTEEFSALQAGDAVAIMGPLGNGFTKKEGCAMLIGGGIGIPPMLELAKELKAENREVITVLGYRNEVFLDEEFKAYGKVYYASEDGAHGVQGTVLDAIREYNLTAEQIYACGPMPMLRAIRDYAVAKDIAAQVSFEEKMACGIGACLACVCQTAEVDEHSQVKNKRVCKDGPVFDVKEVTFA